MYQLINQVIIRTPRLPFSFRNRFEEIIQSPSFHEALFFASDSLYRDAFGKGDNSDRMLAALIRYVNRSSTRCTPFGLFAGVSVSEIEYDAAKTSVIIEGNIQKHIRFDMSFICRLSSILANDKDVQNSIYFTSNSTIYKVGKKIRYIETLGNRHLISCSQTSRDLNKILSMSMYGAKIGKLATFLNKAGYDPVSTQEYLEDLVKSQILIGEFQPLVIGEDVFTHIIKVLNRENIQTKIAIFARQIYNKLKSIERRQGTIVKCVKI